MKNKRILISGASVAGLTLAYFLKKFGFEPTLVERHPEIRKGGYKIDIRGTALDVTRKMGILSEIWDKSTDMQHSRIVDTNGKTICQLDSDLSGGRVQDDVEIMRGRLCKILFGQIPDVPCLFGDSITHLEQTDSSVTVQFKKAPTQTFDLVIGADGLHSNVRALTFGPEEQFLKPLHMYLCAYSLPNWLDLDRTELEFFDPPKYIQLYCSKDDSLATAAFAFPSPNAPIDDPKKLMRQTFADAGWESKRLLSHMDEAPDFYFDMAAQIHMPCISHKRVTLVGDAGYCASPFSGQGTSLALIGAYVLAGELFEAQGDYTKAFESYEKILRPFIQKNQALVKLTSSVMKEKKSSFFTRLSQTLMRLLPAKALAFIKNWNTKNIYKAARSITLKDYQ